jgi:NAD(P)-dependent dehydrogenase (short-subunit alcohol dehydrogenase family)
MITNALSPMRVIETLANTVTATGLIGVMSSGQGSISNNQAGLRELYRGSKAALNMFMQGFAARQAGTSRALVNERDPALCLCVTVQQHGSPSGEVTRLSP